MVQLRAMKTNTTRVVVQTASIFPASATCLMTSVITFAVLATRVEQAEKAIITRWQNSASEKNTKRH